MEEQDDQWYIGKLIKLQNYCAYQERCHQEVRTKLLQLKVYGDALENVISELIQDGFLNEERYAQSYTRGKFRIKKWGRVKIEQNLKKKNVSAYCIKKGMKEIDELEYTNTLSQIIELEVSKLEPPINKIKLTQKLMRKGFEYSLILELLIKH